VRGTFLQNLTAVVGHVARTVGRASEQAADATGAPPAPVATGWDGRPLAGYGDRGATAPAPGEPVG
jgi:hypothetical protein